jgi:hypothetical protein
MKWMAAAVFWAYLLMQLGRIAMAQDALNDQFMAIQMPSFRQRLQKAATQVRKLPPSQESANLSAIVNHVEDWLRQAQNLRAASQSGSTTFRLTCLTMFIRSALDELDEKLSPADGHR